MGERLEIAAGDYRLVAEPARGGSIAAFEWRCEPLFRATCGPSILDVASFPLVPFSNRIADGRFTARRREVRLAPNFPGGGHPHPLHGFGWQALWEVAEHRADRLILRYAHAAGAWPWPFVAEQSLLLTADGLEHRLAVTNHGDTPMPAGLGLHPYFPRTAQSRYHALHRGEWRTDADGLPRQLVEAPSPIDWWHGAPVGSRVVDTVYAGRAGPIELTWPERGIKLRIAPDPALDHTVVFTPPGADYFCVEPVSHPTDAFNRGEAAGTIRWLASGESWSVGVAFEVR